MPTTAALPGLEHLDPRPGWTGNTLPVLYNGDRHCRRCTHGTIRRLPAISQDALFYHGGYGATERTTVDVCLSCGAANLSKVETVRPPRK